MLSLFFQERVREVEREKERERAGERRLLPTGHCYTARTCLWSFLQLQMQVKRVEMEPLVDDICTTSRATVLEIVTTKQQFDLIAPYLKIQEQSQMLEKSQCANFGLSIEKSISKALGGQMMVSG